MAESPNTDLLRRYFKILDQAGKTGEIEAWLSCFSDDVVWEAMEDAPDAGTYRGRDGLRGYFEDWMATVDPLSFEGGEPVEVGEFVVADTCVTAMIKGTDAEMQFRYTVAVRVADGMITTGKEFREHDEAVAYAQASSAPT
jgi:ketosteroid isomerase-like protein